MNKEEAKQKLHNLAFAKLDTKPDDLKLADVMQIVNQIDEPEAGHADEAPRYVKNILARLRELPLHDREVWLKAIMSEFEQDFSRAKWREGYEQGKVEGMVEREKVTIPQFVADWIDKCKAKGKNLLRALLYTPEKVNSWVDDPDNQETFARAWLDGYTVEKEKRYLVKIVGMDSVNGYLSYNKNLDKWFFGIASESKPYRAHHTSTELEEAGFGWVFDCEGIEIEEVE